MADRDDSDNGEFLTDAYPQQKKPWIKAEDDVLVQLVSLYGSHDWFNIAYEMNARGIHKTGKQCRERWLNQLSPNVRKDPWTDEEDTIIVEAHRKLGNKWVAISKLLVGRPPNAVKNRWNGTLHRKAATMSSTGAHDLAIAAVAAQTGSLGPSGLVDGVASANRRQVLASGGGMVRSASASAVSSLLAAGSAASRRSKRNRPLKSEEEGPLGDSDEEYKEDSEEERRKRRKSLPAPGMGVGLGGLAGFNVDPMRGINSDMARLLAIAAAADQLPPMSTSPPSASASASSPPGVASNSLSNNTSPTSAANKPGGGSSMQFQQMPFFSHSPLGVPMGFHAQDPTGPAPSGPATPGSPGVGGPANAGSGQGAPPFYGMNPMFPFVNSLPGIGFTQPGAPKLPPFFPGPAGFTPPGFPGWFDPNTFMLPMGGGGASGQMQQQQAAMHAPGLSALVASLPTAPETPASSLSSASASASTSPSSGEQATPSSSSGQQPNIFPMRLNIIIQSSNSATDTAIPDVVVSSQSHFVDGVCTTVGLSPNTAECRIWSDTAGSFVPIDGLASLLTSMGPADPTQVRTIKVRVEPKSKPLSPTAESPMAVSSPMDTSSH